MVPILLEHAVESCLQALVRAPRQCLGGLAPDATSTCRGAVPPPGRSP